MFFSFEKTSVNIVKLAIKGFQFNLFAFENERRTGFDVVLHKKNISWCHFASNEPEAYLEPSPASTMELFRKYSQLV